MPYGWKDRLKLLGVGGLAASFAWNKLSDSDMWWYLAGGKLFWQEGIPTVNTFSHTFPGYPWKHSQWLFGAVLRGLEVAGGFPAIEAFQMALVAAAYAITFDSIRRKTGKTDALFLLPILIVALAASRFRFTPRPQLVSCLGLALLLNLHERMPKPATLWFAAIGCVWGNFHAGVVFGAAAIAAMTASRRLAGDREGMKRSFAALAAFVAGSLVNPHPGYAYAYTFMHLDIGSILPLDEFRHASWPQYATFFVFAALAVLAVPFRLRRKDYLYPLLILGFLPLSLHVVRIIPKLVVVSLPGLCAAAQDAWDGMARRRRGRIASLGVAAALAVAAAALAVREVRIYGRFFPFGWGIDATLVPEGAARFAEEKGLRGNMYNDLDQGGYLIWRLYPGRRVFVDGRLPVYPAAFHRERIEEMNPQGWPRYIEKYGIDYAITARWPIGAEDVGVGVLFESMGWPLVYIDGIAYVYVRPGTEDARRTEASAFRLIRSRDDAAVLSMKAAGDPLRMRAELGRIEPGRLVREEDFLRFGAAAEAAGDARLCETFCRKGLSLYPNQLLLRFGLAHLLARQGRHAEAASEFAETVRRGEGTEIGRAAAEDLSRVPR